jgi:hypothetical protein
MHEYRPLAKEISSVYFSFKESITFKEFKHILSFVSSKITVQNLYDLSAKISISLEILLKEGSTRMIRDIERYEFEDLIVKIIQKASIILLAPDISLVYRYAKTLLLKSNPLTLDIAPEDISINNIKENNTYICLLNRPEQWKQILSLIEAHKEKFVNFKIIFIVLGSIEIPPEVVTIIPTLSMKRIGELMMELDEREIYSIILNSFKIKQEKTLYQQELEYRTYLTEAKCSK